MFYPSWLLLSDRGGFEIKLGVEPTISRYRDGSPPPLRVDLGQTQGGGVNRPPDSILGPGPLNALEILIFGPPKPNFFAPAASPDFGQISRKQGGVNRLDIC